MTSYSHLHETDVGTKWHLLEWPPEGLASQKANTFQIPFFQAALKQMQWDVQYRGGHEFCVQSKTLKMHLMQCKLTRSNCSNLTVYSSCTPLLA